MLAPSTDERGSRHPEAGQLVDRERRQLRRRHASFASDAPPWAQSPDLPVPEGIGSMVMPMLMDRTVWQESMLHCSQ
jgi:hypothetical protein